MTINSPLPVNQPVNPIVIFMATTTPEKIRDFRLIAEKKHLPIIFEDIHAVLNAFHSAEEDGEDFSANADKKLNELPLDKLRSNDGKEKIRHYLDARGIPSKDSDIYFGIEDGGFNVPKEIWDKTDKSGIPEKVLKRIENKPGPGVDTGPVLSAALGSQALMQRIITAINGRPENKSVSVKENGVIKLVSLNDISTAPPLTFTFQKTFDLYKPSTEERAAKKKDRTRLSTYHYYRPHKSRHSLADMGEDAIINHSVRAALVDSIYERLCPRNSHYDHAFRNRDLLALEKGDSKKFRIGGFAKNQDSLLSVLAGLFPGNATREFSMHLPDSYYISADTPATQAKALSPYQVLASIESVMKDSDAAVLFPDMHSDGKQENDGSIAELTKLYTLFSLEVNKQLNPRDMEKPVFILNHDGSWNNALKIHHDLTDSGMTKEYNISLSPPHEEGDEVKVRSNSYFDVIEATDPTKPVSYERTTNHLMKLLKEKRKGYARRIAQHDPVEEHGETTPENAPAFKVAIFCSASNENTHLNKAIEDLSYELVANEFGIIYGGGDRYTMGAALSGVKRYRQKIISAKKGEPDYAGEDLSEWAKYQAWIGGYSTSQILKSETQGGRFSDDLSYTKQTADIYQRMADMIANSDVIVAAPGGAGTIQEWVAAMILNKQNPETAKPIVFFDPPLNTEQKQIWKKALKIALGEKDYEILTGNDQALKAERSKALGIYIETSAEAVKDRIVALRKEHEQAKRPYASVVAARRAAPGPQTARLH